ncbi:U-scoloptoxin(19)-Sm1a-like [Procambarus clarkii]|uniref:U-scoloptoxin(19)-Sm1a-like n=1 Tax=Procambarus clarkii TaxID=6728 RepID=UPI003743F55A
MRVQLCVLVTLLLGAASPTLSAQVGYGAGEITGALAFSPVDPCSHHGGSCVRESACPAGLLHPKKGLCRSQHKLGVECCLDLPDTTRKCGSKGGECNPIEVCGNGPRDPKGKCRKGEVCCIFVV